MGKRLLGLVSLALLGIAASQTAVFTGDEVGTEGEEHRLHCTISSAQYHARVAIYWVHPETSALRRLAEEMDDYHGYGALQIFNPLTKADAGLYRCCVFKADVSSTDDASNAIDCSDLRLRVEIPASPLKVDECPARQTMEEGKTSLIACKATGHPPPLPRWFKDGVSLDITANNSRFQASDDGLRIQNFHHKRDSGIYDASFVQTNGEGFDVFATASINVSGYHPPEIRDIHLSASKPKEGAPLNISCLAYVQNQPKPSITWHKNGLELSNPTSSDGYDDYDVDRHQVNPYIISEDTTTLVFRNLSVTDAGVYTCGVSGAAASSSASAEPLLSQRNISVSVFRRRCRWFRVSGPPPPTPPA